ncbi:hypothetical protein ABPG74_002047 [Tetrahymena malaccensis]
MKINYLILNLLAIFINFSVQKEYLVSSDFVDPTSNQTPGWSLPTTTYYCSTCNDELVLYSKNITHSSSSVNFSSISQTIQDRNVEGFCFKNFYLYVDTCDITCATCNGPANYFTCQSQIYYPNSKDGSYILTGLFNNYFGQSEILGLGLVISNFKGLKSSFGSSGALTTNCGTNHILGGFWLSGSGASISRSWTGLAPHWSIRVGYTLWKIDQWNNQNFIVKVDGSVVQQIPYGSNVGTSDFCGFNNQLDLSQNQVANFTHSSTTLTINFSTSLTDNVGTQSFGLSNLYVLVDYVINLDYYNILNQQYKQIQCTSNCITCGASGCLACQASYYLYNNVCVTSCPSSTYLSNPTTCVDCNSNCKTCNSPGTCKTNEFQNKANNQCNQCDVSCLTCNGNLNTNCLSCASPLFLYSNCLTCNPPLSFQKSTSKCISTCASGQYLDVNTNKCTQCDSSCLNCIGGSKNQCVDCQSPRYYQKSTTSCELQCQPSYYGNSYTAMCEQCDSSCATCSGPKDNQCLSCKNSLFYLQASGTCVSNCPSGYFQNSLLNQCQKCDSSCKECSGTQNTQCTSCLSQLIFYNNQCLTQCPSGMFQSINQCALCDQSCETCNGQSSSSCLSCKPGMFLVSNQCLSSCPDGYYQNDNQCSKCHPSCKTCIGPNSTQCQTCVDLLIKYNSSCVVECPQQMYMIQTPYKQCLQCHFYCTSGCSGSTKEDCYEIKPIYQIIVYILVFKSFLWIISITVGFLKDNSQQALPLQKVAPLNIQKEAQQNAINNNQLDQKDKNSSLIEYQQNDPNLSPHSKIEDFNLNQGSKSPNIPVNQRGSIVILPQTNNNLMQSKNQLTFNNDANEEDISPNGIGRKRRSRKIDFILKTKIQNSPQKVQSIANMKTTILDQHFFPQDQTTANRSFVSAQNSPTKRNLLSLQNDKSKDQYTADEKLKYSFVKYIFNFLLVLIINLLKSYAMNGQICLYIMIVY